MAFHFPSPPRSTMSIDAYNTACCNELLQVGLIDLDGQCNLTTWFLGWKDWTEVVKEVDDQDKDDEEYKPDDEVIVDDEDTVEDEVIIEDEDGTQGFPSPRGSPRLDLTGPPGPVWQVGDEQ